MIVTIWEHRTFDRFLDVAKFTIIIPLSLLILCKLLFPIVGLKMSSLPNFALNLLKNYHMVFRKFIEYMFQYFTEAVHIINFILYWDMNIQNNDIASATS
jgi:hypothetical protein